MPTKKQYLVIDTNNKHNRRHSAPENLGTWCTPQQNSNLLKIDYRCRASVSDFSVLLENQESESGSSLELDTSNLSRDLSPIQTAKSSPRGSYRSLSLGDIESHRNTREERFSRYSLSSWSVWKGIILGQIVAGCLMIMDITNENIRNDQKNFVTNGQNLPHYILLGVVWTTKLALRNDGRDIIEVIKFSGLRYFFLSVLHVEANYLLLSSFQCHSFLGNQMIDCVSASLSLIIAYVCLEVQFHFVHVFGFIITILGACGLSIAGSINRDYPLDNPYLGDVLRIASGLVLAFNSIAQEIIVKSIDFVEYMGMIGLIGSIICGFQAIALESYKLILKNSTYWTTIFMYSSAQFILSSFTPRVLRDMGATGFHLVLASSGFYSYLVEFIRDESYKFQLGYLLSYMAILIGSSIFIIKKTTMGTHYFFPVKVVIAKGD